MVAKFKTMEPMKYYDRAEEGLSANLQTKRNAILDNQFDKYIATRKYDGEWGMFIRGVGDDITIRSRNISKVTGAYGDMTPKLPHLVEQMAQWEENTVAIGEVCWPYSKTVSTDVGTIMRCLPDKAVARQKEGDEWLSAVLFDVLMIGGQDIMTKGYQYRLGQTAALTGGDTFDPSLYFIAPTIYTNGFREAADTIIAEGGEGVVIQEQSYPYEPGKKAAWRTLKVKEKLSISELKVVSVIPANKAYAGDRLDGWDYWEGSDGTLYNSKRRDNADTPISKPYYYGWMMGIECSYNGIKIAASSGLTDADREWLASAEAQTSIANGELYACLKGMKETADGKVRHPVVVRIRLMDRAMVENKEKGVYCE